MFDHLNILTCFLLIVPSLVISHAGHTQVAIGSRSPTYKVKCDPLRTAASDAFKQDCRDLIQQRAIDGPGPFKGTKTWKEEIWTSTNSIWTTSSRLCAISFSASRPISPQTWIAVKDGINAIANECVDEKGLGGVQSQTAIHGTIHLPESIIVWIMQPYQSLHGIRMAPPPETPKGSPPGTCFQLLSSSSQRLTESEKKIRTGCYQLMGATGALAASLYTGISNPLLGGGFALGGLVLAHQGNGILNAGLKGSGHHEKLRRSQEGDKMLGLPPSFDNPPSSPPRGTSLPTSQPPPRSPSRSPPSSLPSSPRMGPIHPFHISSPPTAAQTRRICGLFKMANPRTLPREGYEKMKACCTPGAKGCLTSWGGLVGGLTNLQMVAPLLSGQAIGGPSAMNNARDFHAAGWPPGPMSHVKLRRSQEGVRMPGISSAPPSLHGPPSPPSPHSPHSPHRPSSLPSMPSSPQHGANEHFEVSSSQGDAELRRRCSTWSSFTEVEKHHMKRICCKLSAGACLFAAGGGVTGLSHTMAGIPFAIGGFAVTLSAIQEFEGAGISQPRPSRAPTLPVKRRRGLVGRRMAEDKKKLEDKTKEGGDMGRDGEDKGKSKKVDDKRMHLEAGSDMGLPAVAEGGEADGGDEGGGGDGGE